MENPSSLLSPTRVRSSSTAPRPTTSRSSPVSGAVLTTVTSDSLRRNIEYPEHDRFIPIRSASNLQEAFERGSLGGALSESSMGTNQNSNQNLMNNLLRASLLGEPLSGMKTTDAALSIGLC